MQYHTSLHHKKMEFFIKLFNEYSWLANAFGILVPLSAGALAIHKWVWPRIRTKDLFEIIKSNDLSPWSSAMAKSYSTIAIVDDQPQDFPVRELQSVGYKIQTFKQVHLSDVDKLSSFDIVFLDMKGIIKDDPDYGGLKLISDLRAKNPSQKICAVSSKTFDPTATDFFKKADKTKRKPLTAQECNAVIDEFLDDLYNPNKLIGEIKSKLQSLPRNVRTDLYIAASGYMNSKDDAKLTSKLESIQVQPELGKKLLNVLKAIANANP